ncbi:MAG: hypothetical protein U5L96_15100 [Owenweeksia sp.]|nr:hypothetical protein [Owenweeksia sp.]
MKSCRAILSFALMGVLIGSTLGFSVSRHYCKGMLVQEHFYKMQSHGCCIDEDATCHDEQEQIAAKCCDEQQLSLPGIEVKRLSTENQKFLPKPASTTLCFTVANDPQAGLSQATDIPSAGPPLKPHGKKLLIAVQRFII